MPYAHNTLLAGNNFVDNGTMTASAAAQQLPNNQCHEVFVMNDALTGAGTYVLIGGTNPLVPLGPGQGIALPLNNTNLVWFKASAGNPILHFLWVREL